MVTRHLKLALLAALASTGCRAGGVGTFSRSQPLAPSTVSSAADLIAEYNRNAKPVRSMEAESEITVSATKSAAMNGNIALERPRDFKLRIKNSQNELADIGSNKDEFWYWVNAAQAEEKALYYCNYDESGKSPLAAAFQPDWIVEAFGLREIPDEEVAETQVRRGKGGTIVLTRRLGPDGPGGEPVFVETVLDGSNHRVAQYTIYSGKQKKLLAQANPSDYQSFQVNDESESSTQTVYLPMKLKLYWAEQKLRLDVGLTKVNLNPEFPASRRQALFVEPTLRRGYPRVNLAERAGVVQRGQMSIRETRPPPPVELREPSPLTPGSEDSARLPRDPVALSATTHDDRSSLIEQVVGPRFPSAPESDVLQAQDLKWRRAGTTAFER